MAGDGRQSGAVGEHIAEHFFFSSKARGGFALYRRPHGEGVKECVRVEARSLPAARAGGDDVVRMELDPHLLLRLSPVLAGDASWFQHRIPRRGRPPKHIGVYCRREGQGFFWLLRLSEGEICHQVPFGGYDCWVGQMLMARLLARRFSDLDQQLVFTSFVGHGRRLYAGGDRSDER